MDKRVNDFIKALEIRKLKFAVAESITCGIISQKLGNTIGTSKVFEGAIVCYTPEVKNRLLNVPQQIIDKYSTESMEVTERLARNLKKLIHANICAAVTGLASEGASESKLKPVGTVFFCFMYRNKMFKEKKLFRGTPMEIREKACYRLMDFIRKSI
jgi:nicotinamide-nucleotide amidase